VRAQPLIRPTAAQATKFLVYVLICAHWLASFFYFIPNLFDAFEGSWVVRFSAAPRGVARPGPGLNRATFRADQRGLERVRAAGAAV
jgi:hypothetical protein